MITSEVLQMGIIQQCSFFVNSSSLLNLSIAVRKHRWLDIHRNKFETSLAGFRWRAPMYMAWGTVKRDITWTLSIVHKRTYLRAPDKINVLSAWLFASYSRILSYAIRPVLNVVLIFNEDRCKRFWGPINSVVILGSFGKTNTWHPARNSDELAFPNRCSSFERFESLL